MTIKLLPIGKKSLQNTDKFKIDINTKYLFVLKVFIIVILIVIFVIFIFRMLTASDPVTYRNLGLYKAESEMETGDLVFVSYHNTFGYFMRGITKSVWTHTGMIMRDGDDLYVLETADYNSLESEDPLNLKKSNGILVLPWETWKSLNKKHSISLMKLNTEEEWDRRKLVREFLQVQNKNLDTFSVGPSVWWKALRKQRFYDTKNEKRNITCSELVVRMYQESGASKKIYTPGSYNTGNLIERTLELSDGFSFEKPVRLM